MSFGAPGVPRRLDAATVDELKACATTATLRIFSAAVPSAVFFVEHARKKYSAGGRFGGLHASLYKSPARTLVRGWANPLRHTDGNSLYSARRRDRMGWDVAPLDEYLGEEIVERIARVLEGRTPVVLGRFTQMLPNNWKLYFENVKDSYHASILHLFFTTFQLNRLSQRGGIIVDPSGGHHVSYSAVDHAAEAAAQAKAASDYADQKIRSESEHRLEDTSVLAGTDEFGDGVTLQILSVFPGFVLQQIQNAIAVRQILPRGTQQTELNWTYLGFEDDTAELREMRLRQANLVGPAGYVSMEDGCVGGFVQRGIDGASDSCSVTEMGGDSAESSESRVTGASIRGFWKAYRNAMGY
jgi:anthranilate 1,2-dioxygenase large subunit